MRSAAIGLGLVLAGGLAASAATGVPAEYTPVWTLQTIDGAPYRAPITLSFTGPGQFAGQGPCNTYSGSAEGSLPAFHPTTIGASRMACPKLAMEQEYLQLLYAVESAELTGAGLVLTTVNGRKLVFSAN